MLDRDQQALEDVRPRFGPLQIELRAPGDHLQAVIDVGLQDLTQGHHPRTVAVHDQELRPKGRLQQRVLVDLVQHHAGHGIALDVDNDADAGAAARLVGDIADAGNGLVVDQLGDAADQVLFVDGVGNLGNDDAFLTVLFLDLRLAAHPQRAATGLIELQNGAHSVQLAAGGEIRAGHDLHQFLDGSRRAVNDQHRGIDHLAQVVRRDVRRHAHPDTGAAVHQQVREARRQHLRLEDGLIEVRAHLDGVLIEVGQKLFRQALQAALRVPVGRRRVPVDTAEVALPIDQRRTHTEVLRHAYQGVIHRLVAVGMVVTDHLTDDLGALGVGVALGQAQLAHGVEDAPHAGLQTVTHVGNRAADVDAQRVAQVGMVHQLLDVRRHVVAADAAATEASPRRRHPARIHVLIITHRVASLLRYPGP